MFEAHTGDWEKGDLRHLKAATKKIAQVSKLARAFRNDTDVIERLNGYAALLKPAVLQILKMGPAAEAITMSRKGKGVISTLFATVTLFSDYQ